MKIYLLKNIKKRYNGSLVLDIDRFEVDRGSIVGLYGPNGSGKSTLLRILAFLEYPSSGEFFFKEKKIDEFTLELRRKVTLLDQAPYLLKRSVYDNIAYGLKIRGIRGESVKRRVGEVLETVGLDPEEYMYRKWYQLSGGEAQRVALAARLVFQPEVLLLDEPTSNLDETSIKLISKATLYVREKWNTTVIVVSHDKEWLDGVCDRVIRIRMGRLIDN